MPRILHWRDGALKLIELFPWSAQARIINFLIDRRQEGHEYFFMMNIAEGSKMNPRTIQTVMPQLVKLKIVQKGMKRPKTGRKHSAYRLKDSTISATLIRLESDLHD